LYSGSRNLSAQIQTQNLEGGHIKEEPEIRSLAGELDHESRVSSFQFHHAEPSGSRGKNKGRNPQLKEEFPPRAAESSGLEEQASF
jgi:hypothetical protein